ncbi:MAG: NADH-quinone oxidoreductase subunit H [bacterium]
MIRFLLLLILPFLFIGLINKTKALISGRKGTSIFQPYFDFIKLMKKGIVISETTSFIFPIAPSINLACMVLAGLLLCVFHFEGDFILFAYVLALGKFFTVIAAMDAGSSFEGMGASREVSYTSLVEPAFFIIISSICAIGHVYSFDSLSKMLSFNHMTWILIVILSIVALFLMILVEGSRTPVDDPTTHLELTMIHEVMVLDNSGVDLGFIFYANALKMLIFTTLIASILTPHSLWGYMVVLFIIAVLIGIIESITARLRLTHIIEYTFILITLALMVMALALLTMYETGAKGRKYDYFSNLPCATSPSFSVAKARRLSVAVYLLISEIDTTAKLGKAVFSSYAGVSSGGMI